MSYLFVYGTLKAGRPNHYKMKETTFLGTAITKHRFPLVVGGPNFTPYLINQPGTGYHIKGEIYKLNEMQFREMDAFEKVPEYYHRLPIELQNWNLDKECYTYFKTEVNNHFLSLPMLNDYPLDNRYIPSWKRQKALTI